MKMCVSLFMLVWMCVCGVVSGCQLSVRDRQRTNDSGTWTDRMKERPCLLSVDCGHRRHQSAHDFHQLAQGFQHPQSLMNIRRTGVCLYMPVDIMNMDMMISHPM